MKIGNLRLLKIVKSVIGELSGGFAWNTKHLPYLNHIFCVSKNNHRREPLFLLKKPATVDSVTFDFRYLINDQLSAHNFRLNKDAFWLGNYLENKVYHQIRCRQPDAPGFFRNVAHSWRQQYLIALWSTHEKRVRTMSSTCEILDHVCEIHDHGTWLFLAVVSIILISSFRIICSFRS